MRNSLLWASTASMMLASASVAFADGHSVGDDVIAGQREALAAATDGMGFGPQSPRDITVMDGANERAFGTAPAYTEMALCDIHFHEGAEHRGGEFTTYAGNGDGEGYGTGFSYDGELTEAELAPVDMVVGDSEHGDLQPGDTIEIHFVHSTAMATVGNSLGTCLSDSIGNPQLRVETVVAVLVSEGGADFTEMAMVTEADGVSSAPNIPNDLGEPVVYAGSTTGPSYNEAGSPFQVTWSVRPDVVRLNIGTVAEWLSDNPFEEDHAHGVRNLVMNPDLLSPIN